MSIYEAIGGSGAVQAVVEDFYRRVTDDPDLAGYFVGTDLNRLKAHQRAFIGAALGGPELYQGRDLARAHAGLGISGAHFDRVVGHLVAALEDLRVPGETIAAIGGALAPLRADIVTLPSRESADPGT
jgi:hemoglobin